MLNLSKVAVFVMIPYFLITFVTFILTGTKCEENEDIRCVVRNQIQGIPFMLTDTLQLQ